MSITLKKAIGAAELRKAILFDLEKSMCRDCNLADHMSYGSAKFKIRVDVELYDATSGKVINTAHEAKLQEGEITEDEDGEKYNFELLRDHQGPNELRKETEQGIPTLVKDEDGKVTEKAITYRDASFAGKKRK